jgi:MEDS: MEthanogen/methylotroph, DcmR Sensory domain
MVAGTQDLNADRHVVLFYGHDHELAGAAVGYLLEALDGGGAAIVIATAAHRRAFEARLAEAGADLAAARSGGTYQALDANRVLDELVSEGRLDAAAFDRVVGAPIRRAGRAGGTVRAFGEVVGLLWDAGLVNAALELEAMWNSLGGRHSFSLLCGYPAGSVARDGCLDAFAEVCRLHRQVVVGPSAVASPGSEAVRSFARYREAPADARHFAVGAARRLGAEDVADDAALVVTELAANAVIHARSGFTIALAARPDAVRISVRDARPLPKGKTLAPTPLHGLGAVDALARRWGVQPLGREGKSVWAELRR